MFGFKRLLRHIFRAGTLVLIGPAGERSEFGDGTLPRVVLRVHRRPTAWRIALNPELALGEAYMAGDISIDNGEIYDLLDLAGANLQWRSIGQMARLRRSIAWLIRSLHQYNPVGRARRHIAHHYELSDTLYSLFLDHDRQYSCAYFAHPDDSLEQAQLQKKRHIAAKLFLAPHHRVLDIGCGWGGLPLYLASFTGVTVTGVTLAEGQYNWAQEQARLSGVANRVQFKLQDYRAETGRYDRIVSVGMFEHVGTRHFDEFFAKLRDLLSDDGVALLHSIGRSDGPGVTNPWIRKYIFPGGYSPALSEVVPAIERAGLCVTDVEILRLHYAETLRAWRRRFMANRARILALYDERFCRMWEFYLAASEVTFRYSGHMVFQVQLTKRQDAVPLTRDYIGEREAAYARAESALRGATAAE